MKFTDHISGLPEVEDYEIEITLSSGEQILVPNIEWKRASLRLLQNHLAWAAENSKPFDLKNFCEYYDEWIEDPDGHHTTIAFLNRYNKEGGLIKRVT